MNNSSISANMPVRSPEKKVSKVDAALTDLEENANNLLQRLRDLEADIEEGLTPVLTPIKEGSESSEVLTPDYDPGSSPVTNRIVGATHVVRLCMLELDDIRKILGRLEV